MTQRRRTVIVSISQVGKARPREVTGGGPGTAGFEPGRPCPSSRVLLLLREAVRSLHSHLLSKGRVTRAFRSPSGARPLTGFRSVLPRWRHERWHFGRQAWRRRRVLLPAGASRSPALQPAVAAFALLTFTKITFFVRPLPPSVRHGERQDTLGLFRFSSIPICSTLIATPP